MENIKTPEQIAQEATEKKTKQERMAAEVKSVQLAVNSAKENPNVEILLRYIMKLSGFLQNPVVVSMSSGDILIPSTVYNGGRESVYHDLRKSMSAETKNIIERSE
jgi:hypothetical protein